MTFSEKAIAYDALRTLFHAEISILFNAVQIKWQQTGKSEAEYDREKVRDAGLAALDGILLTRIAIGMVQKPFTKEELVVWKKESEMVQKVSDRLLDLVRQRILPTVHPSLHNFTLDWFFADSQLLYDKAIGFYHANFPTESRPN